MSDNSSIQWTDATWNPVRGCTKVSPGCANCYAETFAERFRGVKGHPYEQGFDLRLVPEKLDEPLTWKKPRRVFVNSMSDLFQDGVPDEFIDQVFAVMALCPQHTFQVLTKRPERMHRYMALMSDRSGGTLNAAYRLVPAMKDIGKGQPWQAIWPLPNVWLGVSVENQHFADERVPLLLQTPAAVRFISAEPLLEQVDLNHIDLGIQQTHGYGRRRIQHDALSGWENQYTKLDSYPVAGDLPCASMSGRGKLDWVIVGGESGPKARNLDVAWARAIVAQCKAAGVACFVKQLGAHVQQTGSTGSWRVRLRDKKGGDPQEWPEDLRVREFPRTI